MSTIFISHSSKDNGSARELEERLAKKGHASVFLDLDPEKGIVAGQSWERTLYRKLRACRAVIAICTDDYLKSHWCFAEIALARMEGKYIFALKAATLNDSTKLPSILTEKQYIDFRTDPEQGYRRLWRGLNEIDLLGVSGEWDPRDPPYLGLSAFHEKHAALFFGRDEEARAGVELLDRGSPGLIMTMGPSGSGKSSLVRAGILPRLRRNPERWIIIDPFRPGQNPFLALGESLVAAYRRYAPDHLSKLGDASQLSNRLQAWSTAEGIAATDSKSQGNVTDDERVRRLMSQLADLHLEPPTGAEGAFLNFLDWSLDDLRRICDEPNETTSATLFSGNTPLLDIARDLTRASAYPNAQVLFVVDQFEELLGLDQNQNQRAQEFLELLHTTVKAENHPVMVLGTMRSDFLGVFQRHPKLRGIDFESLSLGPIKPEGLRKIIAEPARLGALKLEEGLVERLIDDTETPDALPLLSFTLWVLWRDYGEDGEIELSEYDDLNGLHGAVAREADALLAKGSNEALRRAFVHMARLNEEGQFARQAVLWDSEEIKPVHAILERFIKRRLLVSRSEGDSRTVEVAHEALFRSWKPLKDWLDQSRAEILLKQQISREAEAWQLSHRDKDRLWRGTRLQQAKALLKSGKLDGDDKAFVEKGAQRQFVARCTFISTALAIFIGMAGLTLWTLAAKKELGIQNDFMRVIVERTIYYAWSEDWVPGDLAVKGNELEQVQRIDSLGQGKNLAILGNFDKGRVLAVAHNGFLDSTQDTYIFLDIAINLVASKSQSINILYSRGHCEVVSESVYREFSLPAKIFSDLGHTLAPIENLADEALLSSANVLIVGNAWAAFTPEEIAATKRFVANGGGVILAGIEWSFDQYKNPMKNFNPCTFNEYSSESIPSQDRYPMNDLANAFGLTFVPGYQERN